MESGNFVLTSAACNAIGRGNDLFITAVNFGMTNIVEEIIVRNTDLVLSARRGDLEAVEKFVNDGIDINQNNINGVTALMVSVYNKHYPIVKYLLEKGADINFKDAYGNTALMYAVCKQDEDMYKYLVNAGAGVDIKNKYGVSPGMYRAYLTFDQERSRIILG